VTPTLRGVLSENDWMPKKYQDAKLEVRRDCVEAFPSGPSVAQSPGSGPDKVVARRAA
jgi:hypothetical protein